MGDAPVNSSKMSLNKPQESKFEPILLSSGGGDTGGYGKCYPLALCPPDVQEGVSKGSMNLRSCSSLRCLGCDLGVVRYVNKKWKNDLQYLFFRSYISKLEKLQEGLLPASGFCAYACQCTWHSVDKRLDLPTGNTKWVCGGH